MILVFGKTGQLSTELMGFEGNFCAGSELADFKNPRLCSELIRSLRPKGVINAAAFTSVDAAETNQQEAFTINSETPGVLSRVCNMLSIPIIQISTDYVFSGTGNNPWKENDPTEPLNIYGKSKLAGEQSVLNNNPLSTIIRTSWLFSTHGSNFVKTMIKLSSKMSSISVVNDQFGAPTCARQLALACMQVMSHTQAFPEKHGTYHFCGDTYLSWADFASMILKFSKSSTSVKPIPSNKILFDAIRPKNSMLDTSLFEKNFGFQHAPLSICLPEVLTKLGKFEANPKTMGKKI